MTDEVYLDKETVEEESENLKSPSQRKVVVCDTIQSELIINKLLSSASSVVVIAQNFQLPEDSVFTVHKQEQITSPIEPVIGLEVWHEYMKFRANIVRRPWSERTFLDHERIVCRGGRPKIRGRKKGESGKTMRGILYDLLNQPLERIDDKVVRRWLADNTHRPGSANFAFIRLRAFLNWCAKQDAYKHLVHGDACIKNNDFVPESKPAKGEGIQREQLKVWFEEVKKIENEIFSVYLQVLLLTGARRNELAKLRWADVDLQWGRLRIADKVEANRMIPLTAYVKHLIKKLPKRNAYVFSSPRSRYGHIKDPRRAYAKALAAANLPHMTLHDLRRSFGTLAEWVDVPVGVVAQIMGHKPSALAERHYRRRPLDMLRMWHTKIEKWILKEAQIYFYEDEDVS